MMMAVCGGPNGGAGFSSPEVPGVSAVQVDIVSESNLNLSSLNASDERLSEDCPHVFCMDSYLAPSSVRYMLPRECVRWVDGRARAHANITENLRRPDDAWDGLGTGYMAA